MNLYNSLTKEVEKVEARDGKVRIYSCGPTVYERAHIGNLSSFIYADTLRRTLEADGCNVEHVMNITDVDDKTIRNSHEQYPDLPPMEALKKLTAHFEKLFMDDLAAAGVDIDKIRFVRATDNIAPMQELITDLLNNDVAYEAEDGIYFSIDEYQKRGKKYGQLVDINADNTSHSRIDNDEYDKENPQDFVLWKAHKDGEPAWDFKLPDGRNLAGRPGWHIECSAMSVKNLGQPFEIHTGGVDLKFPHHENEIAQSTALDGDLLARLFSHSEHMLIDNQKMSKSLNNFLTLEDIKAKGFDPLTFRLFVLEGKYNNQRSFTWGILGATKARFASWRRFAALQHQVDKAEGEDPSAEVAEKIQTCLDNDLDTPGVLKIIDEVIPHIESHDLNDIHLQPLQNLLMLLDKSLGLKLSDEPDITDTQKALISEREEARKNQDWQKSDDLRKELEKQGIGVNDRPDGSIWYRL